MALSAVRAMAFVFLPYGQGQDGCVDRNNHSHDIYPRCLVRGAYSPDDVGNIGQAV